MEDSETMHAILSQSRIDQSTAENMEGAMKVIYNIESFNFWGDGALFIFYQPESKTMACYIQNT